MAHVLAMEIAHLAAVYGIEHLGFFTLTFADLVLSIREAQKRFNSLNTHVLKVRYKRAIGCWERQRSGRIHFHLVVVLGADIRSGFDFEAAERGDYRSACSALRAEWAFWRKTAPKYRFGRHELLPVKSTAEGIARYVGKYVSKHISQREERDLGARVVRFIGFKPGDRIAGAQFAWNTDGGWLWRHKLAAWCKSHGIADMDELKAAYGARWAWRLKEEIMATSVGSVSYPSESAMVRGIEMENPRVAAEMMADRVLRSMAFTRTYLLKEGLSAFRR